MLYVKSIENHLFIYFLAQIIGCGVTDRGEVYFTRDGIFMGKTKELLVGDVHPVIAIQGEDCHLGVNWGDTPFVFSHTDIVTKIQNEGGITLIHYKAFFLY